MPDNSFDSIDHDNHSCRLHKPNCISGTMHLEQALMLLKQFSKALSYYLIKIRTARRQFSDKTVSVHIRNFELEWKVKRGETKLRILRERQESITKQKESKSQKASKKFNTVQSVTRTRDRNHTNVPTLSTLTLD